MNPVTVGCWIYFFLNVASGHLRKELSPGGLTTEAASSQSTLAGQHVVVTGGAGYIGSQAALELLSKGDCVTVVDNLVRGRRSTIEALQKIDGSAERLRFAEVDYVGISLC